jgi:hypothetical protein
MGDGLMATMGAVEEKKGMAVFREQRAHNRTECDRVTHCSAHGVKWRCRVVNHSPTGLAIISDIKLCINSIVIFRDPAIHAKVVWSEGNKIGLMIIAS